MSKESTQFLSYHIIDAIFNRLNYVCQKKGGLEKHSYLRAFLRSVQTDNKVVIF